MKKVSILLSMLFLVLSLSAQNNAEANDQQESKVLSCKAKIIYTKEPDSQWPVWKLFSCEPALTDEDHWAEKGPDPEFIIKLDTMCMISEFRIIDIRALRKGLPNTTDYFIYVAETIDETSPRQSKWNLVVTAEGEKDDYKYNSITPVKGQYVRFLAKLSNKETARLYRFEVWGKEYVEPVEPEPEPEPIEPEESNNMWKWIGIGFLVLIVLVGGGFFFFKRKEFRL